VAVATFDAKVQQIIEQTLHCPIAGKLQRRFQTGAFVHRTGGGGGQTHTERERERSVSPKTEKQFNTSALCHLLGPFFGHFCFDVGTLTHG
jgi:hypothetical protein